MIISEQDAQWAAGEFINYFSQMGNIEDYLRFVKKEVIKSSNTLAPLHDEFLNEDIHPEDMEFDIKFIGDRFQQSLPQEHYNTLLKVVSSHNNESNIPGRELRWMVYEKNTGKVVGFIRFGSPTINSKPRNEWLGKTPDLSIFNRHAAMGFVIDSLAQIILSLTDEEQQRPPPRRRLSEPPSHDRPYSHPRRAPAQPQVARGSEEPRPGPRCRGHLIRVNPRARGGGCGAPAPGSMPRRAAS